MRDRPSREVGRGWGSRRFLPALLVSLALFLASNLLPGPAALMAGAGPGPAPAEDGAGAPGSGPAFLTSAVIQIGGATAWAQSARKFLQWSLEVGLPALSGLPPKVSPAPPAAQQPAAPAVSPVAPASPASSPGTPATAVRQWWASLLRGVRLEPRGLLALGLPVVGGRGTSAQASPWPAAGPATGRSGTAPGGGSPAAGVGQPASGGSRPATGDAQPATGGSRPAAGGAPPAAGGATSPAAAQPAAPSPAAPAAASPAGPMVLIYHTHAREAYGGPGAGQPPKEEGAYSEDPAKTVLAAGEALAESLWRDHGIPTLHCDVIHDRDGRIGAYLESEATVKRLLGQYRTLRLALDVHRDSQGRAETTVASGGRSLARVMVVLGQGNPNWEANYSLALQLVELMDDRCPGLSRGIFPKSGSFNQDLLPASLLLEVGGPENTPAEAAATGQVLAGLFAELVQEHRLPPLSGAGTSGTSPSGGAATGAK